MAKRKIPSPACAGCRVQRKKCREECVLAPHFPSDDPAKFAIVQSVFGTSHILKILQGLKAEERAEAVNSMVYEATARVDDPVHGCVNIIQQMQKRIAELEAQLKAKQEELVNMRCQNEKLFFLLSTKSQDFEAVPSPIYDTFEDNIFEDEVDLWEPLWEI